jgi:glutamate synthase (ferredoxin)
MDDLIGWTQAHPITAVALIVLGAIVLLALRDVTQNRHTIVHNFPVVGHLRYFLEMIGPELRQYWVANDKEEKPFSRDERRWVYATSKKQNNTFGFGTTETLYEMGYPIIKHTTFPVPDGDHLDDGDHTAIACAKVIGETHGRKRPYRPGSVVNVSAMSFGSLGERAIRSLNAGSNIAGCYHNTGEGGISPHHRQGGDLMWQLGTGYFGARNAQGGFSIEKMVEQVEKTPEVRAIEIKLSQGAKPGKGGILPGAKVTPEISAIRGIPVGQDCLSPNHHSEFSNVDGLIDFVERIADKTGLPVGVKSAIGQLDFWDELARRMKTRGAGPDFITVDGGEGGTGAAPLTFADHVALPFKVGFARLYRTFQEHDMANQVIWIGSGKLGFPDRAIVAFAMGCDVIGIAREAMLSLGCIQAQKCHTGECPAGIATQSTWLQGGINVGDKTQRVANYIQGFRKELLTLSHAAGYRHPAQFTGSDIEFSTGVNRFTTLEDILGYRAEQVEADFHTRK